MNIPTALLASVTDTLIDGALETVSRLRRRSRSLDRLFGFAARLAASRMRTIRRGLGRGLLLDVGENLLSLLIRNLEPDVELALGALLSPHMTLYDAGANVGYYTVIGARLVGPTGRVVAFEPTPQSLAKLRANLELNRLTNVTVRSEALGDNDGTASFVLHADPTQNKIAA